MSQQDGWQPPVLGPMTEEEAELYLQARNHANLEIETIKAQAKAKIAEVQHHLDMMNQRDEHRLEQFIRSHYEATGKKTFNFWGGTCRLTHQAPRIVVEDEAAAIEFVRENGIDDQFLTTPQLRKGEFQKYITERSRGFDYVPPGCRLTEARESFSISFPKTGGAASHIDDEASENDDDQ